MFGLALSTPGGLTCARHQGLAAPLPAAGPAAPRRASQPPRPQQRGGPRAPASSLDDVSAAAAGAAGGEQPPSSPADVQDEVFDYVQHCQEAYGQPGLIDFSPGANGLPKATLQHPNGASCEVYLHGGAVTSWRHRDGREMLHLRQGNAFDGANPIRGGVQIAWPQFGVGALPTHGFAQNLHWSVVATGWREPEHVPADARDAETAADWRPSLTLYASTDEEWEQRWPHKFEAAYTITLMEPDPPEEPDEQFMARAAADFSPSAQQAEREEAVAARARAQRAAPPPAAEEQAEEAPRARPSVLRCELQVHNCDDAPFTFTTGLRAHFATKDIPLNPRTVRTLGLFGKYVMDYTRNPLGPALWTEQSHYVNFGDMQPRSLVYADAGVDGDVLFCPGTTSHFKIHNTRGFADISVVHPTGAAGREARSFVELGSARALRRVTLQPGETWVGEMQLTAHDEYWPLPAWEVEDPSGVPVPEPTPEQLQLQRRPAIEI